MSYLHRSIAYMPKTIPAFKDMLVDIGNPHPREIAKALKVTERSVWRWLAANKAPHSVMLAIFWLTKWGMSEIEAAAHNAAIGSAAQARCLQEELERVTATLQRISKISDFGSSNDPAPGVAQSVSMQFHAQKIASNPVENRGQPLVKPVGLPAVKPSIHAGFQQNGYYQPTIRVRYAA
jgi:predicted DNA-binding transcriptional regulator AlpA